MDWRSGYDFAKKEEKDSRCLRKEGSELSQGERKGGFFADFFFPSFFLAESSCRSSFCLSVSPSLSVQASNELFRDCAQKFDHPDTDISLKLLNTGISLDKIDAN